MTRLAWWSCPSGISGDMALGALVAAGAPLAAMQSAVDALATEPVELRAGLVTRGGVRATRVEVIAPAADRPRRWPDIRAILETADLDQPVRTTALETFRRLAGAEAEAHGSHPDDVHFHEVGALDALADIVGTAAGLAALGVVTSGCSWLALGGGTATGAHGPLPAPGPAVLNLLRAAGARLVVGGPAELTTPTGAALLAATVTAWGDSPPMVPLAHGFGAGSRDLPDRANVAGLVIGDAEPRSRPEAWLVVEANVDDLDPRLWPGVLAEVLRAGAADVWLTPVLMKKGRPAHTVHVLCPAALAGQIRRVLYRDTSTIGTRSFPVAKDELPREVVEVIVDGQPIRVKVSRLGDGPPTTTPEFDDVALAAEKLGRSARDVLAEAAAAARALSGGAPPR